GRFAKHCFPAFASLLGWYPLGVQQPVPICSYLDLSGRYTSYHHIRSDILRHDRPGGDQGVLPDLQLLNQRCTCSDVCVVSNSYSTTQSRAGCNMHMALDFAL